MIRKLNAPALMICGTVAAVAVIGVGTRMTDSVELRAPLPAGVSASVRRAQSPHAVQPAVSAVAFLREVIGRLAANNYVRAWTSLDPRQQRLVDQDAYARCEGMSPIPGRLDSIEVVESHAARVVVPGTGGAATSSIVVTFRLAFAPRPSENPVVVRVRAHALRSAGRWAWMLPTDRLALHRSGRCGASPPYVDPTL